MYYQTPKSACNITKVYHITCKNVEIQTYKKKQIQNYVKKLAKYKRNLANKNETCKYKIRLLPIAKEP